MCYDKNLNESVFRRLEELRASEQLREVLNNLVIVMVESMDSGCRQRRVS